MIAVLIISAGLLGTSGHVEIVPPDSIGDRRRFFGWNFCRDFGSGWPDHQVITHPRAERHHGRFCGVERGAGLFPDRLTGFDGPSPAAALVGSEVVVSSYKRIRWGRSGGLSRSGLPPYPQL